LNSIFIRFIDFLIINFYNSTLLHLSLTLKRIRSYFKINAAFSLFDVLKKKAVLALIMYLSIGAAWCQIKRDTVNLTLGDAEQIFVQKNLLLIADKFNIQIARANIIQAGLWNNPSLYLEQNIYNPINKRILDYTYTGENIVQIQQLFLLAGKRNKRVQLEEINMQIAEFQFYDLMRTLKFELRTNYFDLYFLQQISRIYDREINSIQKTITAFELLLSHGNISLKEVVRLKALLFTLESERLATIQFMGERQLNLGILLNDSTHRYIKPLVNKDLIDSVNLNGINLPALTDTALLNRTDLKLYEADLRYDEKNLSYQRALAVPDLQLGGVYDRQGNFVRDYTGITFQMNLPAFNRNQGNIQASKYQIQQSKVRLEEYRKRVVSEVFGAFFKTTQVNELYKSFDKTFIIDYDKLISGVLQNYERKNISLIEFIDFYQSYKESYIRMNELERQRLTSFELLNYYSGKNLFNY
jgi:outer membrane protein, heavy metal efflux system